MTLWLQYGSWGLWRFSAWCYVWKIGYLPEQWDWALPRQRVVWTIVTHLCFINWMRNHGELSNLLISIIPAFFKVPDCGNLTTPRRETQETRRSFMYSSSASNFSTKYPSVSSLASTKMQPRWYSAEVLTSEEAISAPQAPEVFT